MYEVCKFRERRMGEMGQKGGKSFSVGHLEAPVFINPTQNNMGQYCTLYHKTPNSVEGSQITCQEDLNSSIRGGESIALADLLQKERDTFD